jgi:hypothetical protein
MVLLVLRRLLRCLLLLCLALLFGSCAAAAVLLLLAGFWLCLGCWLFLHLCWGQQEWLRCVSTASAAASN